VGGGVGGGGGGVGGGGGRGGVGRGGWGVGGVMLKLGEVRGGTRRRKRRVFGYMYESEVRCKKKYTGGGAGGKGGGIHVCMNACMYVVTA